jgi:hypothetical protein
MSSEQVEPPAPATPSKPQRNRQKVLRRLAVVGVVLALAGITLSFFARRSALSPNDAPQETYQKILNAYGGQKALDRWTCGELKFEYYLDRSVAQGHPGSDPIEFQIKQTFELSGRFRQDVWTLAEPRTKVGHQISNGDIACAVWPSESRRWRLDESQILKYPRYLHYYHPHFVLLEGAVHEIIGEERRSDGGTDVVMRCIGTPIRCKVDKRTKLIHEVSDYSVSEVSALIPLQGFTHMSGRIEYDEYRMTEGGMIPGRITGYLGSSRAFEFRFVSVEFRENIDPALFELSANVNEP